ncbi:hypothetical protein ACOMHN_000814 [Nucella lapillus]
MTEVEEEQRVEQHYKPYFHPFHGHRHHHAHLLTPVQGGEAYQRLQWQKQHVLFELKMWVMVLVGAVVIVACVVYIVLQCRSRLRPTAQPRGLREDEKELFGSTETLENLIPADNSIRLKVRKEKEFFV